MHPYKTLDQIKNTCGLFLQTYSALGDLFPFLKHLIFQKGFQLKSVILHLCSLFDREIANIFYSLNIVLFKELLMNAYLHNAIIAIICLARCT